WLRLHAVHSAGTDHDVGDYQLLRQRGLVVLRRQVCASYRGNDGFPDVECHHYPGPRCRWRYSRLAGRGHGDGGSARLHPTRGATSPDNVLDGIAVLNHLLVGRIHQRGLRTKVRRHFHHSDFRADTAYLSRRRLLFHIAVARGMAEGVTPEPDPLHGQRIPLRYSWHLGHRNRTCLPDRGAVHHRALFGKHDPDESRHRHEGIGGSGMCGRFAFYSPAEAVAELFEFEPAFEIAPRYNIAPTEPVPVVRSVRPEGRE